MGRGVFRVPKTAPQFERLPLPVTAKHRRDCDFGSFASCAVTSRRDGNGRRGSALGPGAPSVRCGATVGTVTADSRRRRPRASGGRGAFVRLCGYPGVRSGTDRPCAGCGFGRRGTGENGQGAVTVRRARRDDRCQAEEAATGDGPKAPAGAEPSRRDRSPSAGVRPLPPDGRHPPRLPPNGRGIPVSRPPCPCTASGSPSRGRDGASRAHASSHRHGIPRQPAPGPRSAPRSCAG